MTEDHKTRVLLVDDHPLVRQGIRAVLEGEPDIEVVGEASTGEEALRMTGSLSPEIVVMDIQMPGMDGIEATREVKRIRPECAVIMLTVNDEEMFLVESVQAGASAYVLKEASGDMLVQSIRALVRGGTLIPTDLLRKALSTVQVQPRRPVERVEFTSREMEILNLLTQGYGNKEMAGMLHLAHVTVKKHVHRIIAKLGVSDRTQAALKACRMGLVEQLPGK
ncbi:MAG: response regulator transcription factor [Armatimonadetes bacterium]|nr:response regulator transcription factor [Armatimonadota bacterium]